jgi:hypothetical protein
MKLSTKKIIFFAYFLAIFILRAVKTFHFSFSFLFFSSFISKLFSWLLGAIVGGYFIKIEQLFYAYIIRPNDAFSIKIKELTKKNNWKELWGMLRIGVDKQKLAFRSALFQGVWVILAFFAISSTAGYFGKALVMAIGLHLLLDEWEDWQEKGTISWLFWQIKRPVLAKEQRIFLYIMTVIFSLLSILLI